MAPPRPFIVKLGGSVLTRKGGEARVRPKILVRLAEELTSGAPPPMVILHGAGSFGHPGAVRFGLARAPAPGAERTRRRGAAIVSAEVRRLHSAVLRGLIDAGGSPWSVPPGADWENRAGELARGLDAPFVQALASGWTPVSFGDVVPDEAWGSSILSGDTIAVHLARSLNAARVLFVSDVPGILRRTPDGRRSVVPEIDERTIEELTTRAGGPDVTGGIRGKARAMLAISAAGVDAGLISGLSDGLLSRALRGEFVYGSWSRARPS